MADLNQPIVVTQSIMMRPLLVKNSIVGQLSRKLHVTFWIFGERVFDRYRLRLYLLTENLLDTVCWTTSTQHSIKLIWTALRSSILCGTYILRTVQHILSIFNSFLVTLSLYLPSPKRIRQPLALTSLTISSTTSSPLRHSKATDHLRRWIM